MRWSDPLVVAAENYYVLHQRQPVGQRLREHLGVGSREDDLVVVALGFQSTDGAVDRLDLHDHSRLAAEGIVVDFAVAVGSVIAEVMNLDVDEPATAGTVDDRAAQRRLKHLGQYGQYVNAHGERSFSTAKLQNSPKIKHERARLDGAPPQKQYANVLKSYFTRSFDTSLP